MLDAHSLLFDLIVALRLFIAFEKRLIAAFFKKSISVSFLGRL